MALDLSMLSSRRPPSSTTTTTSPTTVQHYPGHAHTESYQESALALVTKKRVRFQDLGARTCPYGLVGGGRGWRRAPGGRGDSDEENRPPAMGPVLTMPAVRPPGGAAASAGGAESSPGGGSAPAAEFDSRLSTSPDHQAAPHPAAMTGHVTVPAPSHPGVDHLPSDPRDWSRVDVAAWLTYMRAVHPVLTALHPDRFLMNGKALCLMSPNMFSYRVPQGGRTLFRDFQARLSRALADAPPTTTCNTSTSAHSTTSVHSTTTTMTLPTVVAPS